MSLGLPSTPRQIIGHGAQLVLRRMTYSMCDELSTLLGQVVADLGGRSPRSFKRGHDHAVHPSHRSPSIAVSAVGTEPMTTTSWCSGTTAMSWPSEPRATHVGWACGSMSSHHIRPYCELTSPGVIVCSTQPLGRICLPCHMPLPR